MTESLAQLRDAVLERHVKVVYVEGTLTEPFCDFCGHEWPCPEYRLATALSPENVAAGLHADCPTERYGMVGPDCQQLAAVLLGAIPVDTQEGGS